MEASLSQPFTTFFRNPSFPSRRPTLSTQYSRNSATGLMDYSVPFLKLPSRTQRRPTLLAFWPFAGPSRQRRRRNSLREKLVPGQEKAPESKSGNSRLTEDEGNVDDFNKNFDFSRNSAMRDKLENWVDRYREESEFWGIGTGPIFTIFQNLDGDITRVSVDEDEILKRSRIQALYIEGEKESDELKAVNSKISRARVIAKEIEIGAYTMPRNSSIANFVSDGNKLSLVGVFHALSSRRESLIGVFPGIGLTVLCCLCILGAARKLFGGYEMLRRKKKSRMEREDLERSSVEVLENGDELPFISGSMPQLNRDELMKNIARAKEAMGSSVLSVPPGRSAAENLDFEKKVREIRDMVRTVREAEIQKQSSNGHIVDQNDPASIAVDSEIHAVENNTVNCPDEVVASSIGEFSQGESLDRFEEQETSVLKNSQKILPDIDIPETVSLTNKDDVDKEDNIVGGAKTKNRGIPKVITSLKEANEYLSSKGKIPVVLRQTEEPIRSKRKHALSSNYPDRAVASRFSDFKLHENDEKIENLAFQNVDGAACLNLNYSDHKSQDRHVAESKVVLSDNSSLSVDLDQVDGVVSKKFSHPDELDVIHDEQLEHVAEVGRSEYAPKTTSSESDFKLQIPKSSVGSNKGSSFDKCKENDKISQSSGFHTSFNFKNEDALEDLSSKAGIFSNSSSKFPEQTEKLPKTSGKNWVENNFQQFDSIIEKIGIGFQDNYKLAKVKAQENPLSSAEIGKLSLWGEDEELEWMKDENLLEIVFQVRENELAGRDPFYSMDAEDQRAFFHGLERKAEKVNEKLAGVHEWMHSKIENLDYGTDGIGLDDPLEKIIPRWKGPPIHQDPEFIEKFVKIGNSVLADNIRNLDYILGDKHGGFQKSENNSNSDGNSPDSPVNIKINLSKNGTSTTPKTLIECSDGSSRVGKKNMKEQWQHTKRWSQGFLEVYNAETDPEVKSILKDMGKDLDRWLTDKDMKNVADMMTRMPKKKKRFIEKKMIKVKREVEKYGAQAVVSKYKEYAGEKKEDYFWWLDLQFVLCIELYYLEDDVPRIGFYSLEMADDLELNPKQFHVIAFEDAGDSKNLCYILQNQMDIMGSGKAFVVARPPKDAFREAKANGFSLTLLRKGEVKINVDQTLEEVEEQLKEIGSKIYHDKIMNERGFDIYSIMKGVIAANKSSKR